MRKTSILHLQMQEKESPHPELVEGRTADVQAERRGRNVPMGRASRDAHRSPDDNP
jgi:hypothetical protein